MTILLSQYIQHQDQGDLAPAWDRVMQSIQGDHETIVVPPGDYETSRPLDVTKRVLVLAWGASLKARQSSAVRMLEREATIVGLEVLGGGKQNLSHGFDIQARSRLVWCTARNFGRDGFTIVGDVNHQPPTSASITHLIGCESTGHGGRGFATRGGDANVCLFLGCSTSACDGEYDGRLPTAPKVGGYHDQSFLGCYFVACHGGAHPTGALGYCLGGDSSRSLMVGCYQEMGNETHVAHSNVAAWNVGPVSATSTGGVFRGNTITGKFSFGALAGQVRPALNFLPTNIDGMLAEVRSVLDTHAYALARETVGARAGWWTMRRANTASQDVLAWRADGKANQPAQLWAPLGMLVGASKKALSDQWMASIEARLAALESKP